MDFSVMAADEAQLFKGLVDLQGAVREATCVAIATMFGDVESSDEAEAKSRRKLQRMVDAGLLKKLIPRVVDPLPMVRQHALGALRNISVTGGLELCELMTTQNVVTPLVKVITENATDNALAGSGDLRAVQLLEQAVALLSNLCELPGRHQRADAGGAAAAHLQDRGAGPRPRGAAPGDVEAAAADLGG